jgi:hypothetical protein
MTFSSEAAELDCFPATVGRYGVDPSGPAELVGLFTGMRALLDDGSSEAVAVTRDCAFDLNDAAAVDSEGETPRCLIATICP